MSVRPSAFTQGVLSHVALNLVLVFYPPLLRCRVVSCRVMMSCHFLSGAFVLGLGSHDDSVPLPGRSFPRTICWSFGRTRRSGPAPSRPPPSLDCWPSCRRDERETRHRGRGSGGGDRGSERPILFITAAASVPLSSRPLCRQPRRTSTRRQNRPRQHVSAPSCQTKTYVEKSMAPAVCPPSNRRTSGTT